MTVKASEVLAAVERKRGYLLTYHKMIGSADPELLVAYDNFYENLTLKPRAFTAQQRELVWAALQVAADEEHGHIHMRRAVKAGLTLGIIADAVALAGAAEAHRALWFGYHHWNEWVSTDAATERYLKICEAARGEIEPALAEIVLATCHGARRTYDAMRIHLRRAFPAGATVRQMAEALSYMLLPCGGPTLIDAVEIWEQEAKGGRCPSPYGS
ncbi:MAG: hypothetical protein EXQ85_08640 [Alphaproteobacteria bacterium]|nr:hypothetical protein [Alphaproteobacteria bacterium]